MSGPTRTRYLLFAVTFALAALALLVISHEADAAFEFTVEGSSTGTGEPGDQVSYSLKIKNNGASDRDYNFTIVNTPPTGWNAFVLPTSINVAKDGGTGFTTLYVKIWDWAYEGDDALITVQATEDSGSSKTVSTTTEALQIYGTTTTVNGPTSGNVDPEETVQFTFNIENSDGNGIDNLDLSLDIPSKAADWTFVYPSTLNLDRNESQNVTLDVTPDINAEAGLAGITFIATSEDGVAVSTATITVRVNKLPDLNVAGIGSSSKTVRVDPLFGMTTATYSFSITNKGNSADTFLLSVEAGDWQAKGWSATLDTLEASNVAVDETVTLSDVLVVTVPDNATANDQVTIVVRITSDANNSVSKTYTSRTRVLQDYKPRLSVEGDNTKNVEPDNQINFTLNITNNGNGEDDIELSLTGDQAGWGSFAGSLFTLGPGESTTTILKVRPPKNQLAQNGYVITVVATSEDATNTSTRPVYINVDQIYDVSISVVGVSLQNADPDEQITFQVEILNKGNGEDSFQLTRSGDKPSWASVRDSVTLDAGALLIENVTVKPDSDAIFGDYDIIITATSEEDPAPGPVNASTTLTVRVNQDYDVDMLIDPNAKYADPGGEVFYEVRILNTGTGFDNYTLTYTKPSGWVVNFNTSKVMVAPNGYALVNLSITVHKDADNIEYYVNVTATSDGEGTGAVSVTSPTLTTVNQKYDIRLSGPTQQEADPEETFIAVLTLENRGTGDDTVIFTVMGPPGTEDWVMVIPPTVDINEGETLDVTLTITVDEFALKGTYDIVVEAYSQDTPSQVRNHTLKVKVTQTYDVQMLPGTSTNVVNPGDATTFMFTVRNSGTGSDTFELTYETIDNVTWEAISLSTTVVDLNANEEQTVNLTVTTKDNTPPKEPDGYLINITATSTENETVTDTIQAFVKVNPFNKVAVNSPTTFDDITPSRTTTTSISYFFTVKNDGTEADTFTLELEPSPYNRWASLGTPSVDLDSKAESSQIELVFQLPGYESNEDTVRPGDYEIVVRATSDNDDTVFDNLTFTTTIKKVQQLTITTDTTSVAVEPGDVAGFDIKIKNEGNSADTVSMSIPTDTRDWATFDASGSDAYNVLINASEELSVRVLVSLPVYANATGQDKTSLESSNYPITVKATSSDGKASDTQSLTTSIQTIYGAQVTVQGSESVVTYPSTETQASNREERFTLKLKNLGNKVDTIDLEVVATSYPSEWTVGIYQNPSGGSPISSRSVAAGSTSTLYLRVTPDQESDTGNFTVIVEASARNGADDPVTTSVSLDVREPDRSLTLTSDESLITLAPDPADSEKNTARFKIVVTNTGTHDDNFIAKMDTILGDDWTTGFFTENTGSPGSPTDRWSSGGEKIDSGRSDDLWFIVVVNPAVDEGNYTMRVTVKNFDEDISETLTLQVNINAPQRGLTLTAIDTQKDISPEYKGSDTTNRVRFKLKLENTGTHTDKFIPDVESTLEDDWDAKFYQDSNGNVQWPTNGLDIDAGETDDLYVFVIVDDAAEEDTYPITISVGDEEDDTDARGEVELTVNVQRPDLEVEREDIQLEINGAVDTAAALKQDDTLKVLVTVHNTGQADADNALVEIYLYPRIAPETTEEINDLESKGFVNDPDRGIYLYSLYAKSSNVRAGTTKEISTSAWIVEGGEWYVEVWVDFDPLDLTNGRILETLEGNNDAQYSDLLQIRPDLAIVDMWVDQRYLDEAPNIDDLVTFTVKVRNDGAADVDDARLYIWHENLEESDNKLRVSPGSKSYVLVDVPALEQEIVNFRWKAKLGDWPGFRAEINPKYSDVGETAPVGATSDHFIDELNRYTNNKYPSGGEVLSRSVTKIVGNQTITVNETVAFKIFPDFIIKDFKLDPSKPEKNAQGDPVTLTVTLKNQGSADWRPGSGILKVTVKDGEGYESTQPISKEIRAGKELDVEFDDKWKTPDEDKVTLEIEVEFTGADELDEDNNVYTAADATFKLAKPKSVVPDVAENPLMLGLIGVVALMAIMLPIMFKMGKKKGGPGEGPVGPGGLPQAKPGLPSAGPAGPGGPPAAGPPKISVVIHSPDGKVAKPKMLPIMPVSKLLEQCVKKFGLAEGEYQLMLGDKPLDPTRTLAEAGVKEGDKIVVAPQGGAPPAAPAPAVAAPPAPPAPPVPPQG